MSAGLPLVLTEWFVALAWAVLSNRRTPREDARAEEATRELYDRQNADDKANGGG